MAMCNAADCAFFAHKPMGRCLLARRGAYQRLQMRPWVTAFP